MGVGASVDLQAKEKAKARWNQEVKQDDAPIVIASHSLEWFEKKFPPGCLHSVLPPPETPSSTSAGSSPARDAGLPDATARNVTTASVELGEQSAPDATQAERVWNIYRQGSFGENVLHLVLLRRGKTPEGKEIARYLVSNFGKRLVNAPLQNRKTRSDKPGAYEGETCLHIALVVDELDLVKLLVEAGADVRARCWGPFFKTTGNTFYGEYPLHFAACLCRFEAAAYLAKHGALVSDRDTHGNTALHMVVYHNLIDMYDHLLDNCAPPAVESLSAWQDEVQSLKNGMGLTPLTLAASLGLKEMFVHVIKRTRKTKWTYGPVQCYSIITDDIDTDPHADRITALQCIVDHGQRDLLSVATVSKIVTAKWDDLQRYMFVAWLAAYLATMALYMSLLNYFRHGPFSSFDKTERVLRPNFAYPGSTRADSCEVLTDMMASSNMAGDVVFRCDLPDTERLLFGDQRFSAATLRRQIPLACLMLLLLLLSIYDLLMVRRVNKRTERLQLEAAHKYMAPPPETYEIPWEDPVAAAAAQAAADRAVKRKVGFSFDFSSFGSFGDDEQQLSHSKNSVAPAAAAASPPAAGAAVITGAAWREKSRKHRAQRGGDQQPGEAVEGDSAGGAEASAVDLEATDVGLGGGGDQAVPQAAGEAVPDADGDGESSAQHPRHLMRLGTIALVKSRVHGILGRRVNMWKEKQLREDLRDLHKRILYLKLLKEGKRPVLDKVSLPLMERVGAKLATVVPIPSGSDLFLYAFIIVYCTHLINWLTGKSWDGLELSIGALQGWLYSLTFAKGVRGLGHLVIIFFRMLRADLLNWAIVYLIVLVAFSAAIFVVMTTEFPNPDTNVISGDFGSMSATIFTNFRFTFGDPSYTPYRQMPENQGWANFLFIAYSICTQVVLANLFIAMLNHTFDVNYKKADEESFMSFTDAVLRLERRCPQWLLKYCSSVSFTEEDTPRRYELVEEVDAPSMGADDEGSEGGEGGGGAGEGGGMMSRGGGSKAGLEWLLRELNARSGGMASYEQHQMSRVSHVQKI